MFENIVQKLVSILQANTLIQSVYDYEREDPEGTPFATITPSSNDNEYATTSENRRSYALLIRLFVERAGQSTNSSADSAMRELVDSVLDDLDKNWGLNGLVAPTGYSVLFMRAAPSSWGYAGREMGYRVAEIRVRVEVDVDVYAIS